MEATVVWLLGAVAWMGASVVTALTVSRALGEVGKQSRAATPIPSEEANRQRAG